MSRNSRDKSSSQPRKSPRVRPLGKGKAPMTPARQAAENEFGARHQKHRRGHQWQSKPIRQPGGQAGAHSGSLKRAAILFFCMFDEPPTIGMTQMSRT